MSNLETLAYFAAMPSTVAEGLARLDRQIHQNNH